MLTTPEELKKTEELEKAEKPTKTVITIGQAIFELLKTTSGFQTKLDGVTALVTEIKTEFQSSNPMQAIAQQMTDMQIKIQQLSDKLEVVLEQPDQTIEISAPRPEAFTCLRVFKTLEELTLDESPSTHKAEFTQARKAFAEHCVKWISTEHQAEFQADFEQVSQPFSAANLKTEAGHQERSQRYQQIQELRLKLLPLCALSETDETSIVSVEPQSVSEPQLISETQPSPEVQSTETKSYKRSP